MPFTGTMAQTQTQTLRMEIRSVHFNESNIVDTRNGERKKRYPYRKKKRRGRDMAKHVVSHQNASGIYDALQQTDNRERIIEFSKSEYSNKVVMAELFEKLFQDCKTTDDKGKKDYDIIFEDGLKRLYPTDGQILPAYEQLSDEIQPALIKVGRIWPGIIPAVQDDSSIESSEASLNPVDLADTDLATDKQTAFRVTVTAAFEVARQRKMTEDELKDVFSNIFNVAKPEYKLAYDNVVSRGYKPGDKQVTDKHSENSHYDDIVSSCYTRFSNLFHAKKSSRFDVLYCYVFKGKAEPAVPRIVPPHPLP